MKLNKSNIKKILTIIIVVLAIASFLHQQITAPEAAEPAPPESSQAVTLPEEETPEAEETSEEQQPTEENLPEEEPSDPAFVLDVLDENGSYTSMEDVADYIHIFGRLPQNFITKNEARDLGWESSEGNLWEVAKGKSIGGDRFYNNDDQLPEVKGRKYYECDINYSGGFRGGERIVYSNDGLIYYTSDHYESFECLYGEE